jgi:hypothetical protein
MTAPIRDRLADLLAHGRVADAASLARERARAGHWNLLILATLVLHGDEQDAQRDEAIERLGRGQLIAEGILANQARLADELAADAQDVSRWVAILSSLAITGRLQETLAGLEIASQMGAPAALWHAVIRAAAAAGATAAVAAVIENGAARYPMDPHLAAMLAIARVGAGDLASARTATIRALALNGESPGTWLAQIHVALAEGDLERVALGLDTVRQLGLPDHLLLELAAAATRGG